MHTFWKIIQCLWVRGYVFYKYAPNVKFLRWFSILRCIQEKINTSSNDNGVLVPSLISRLFSFLLLLTISSWILSKSKISSNQRLTVSQSTIWQNWECLHGFLAELREKSRDTESTAELNKTFKTQETAKIERSVPKILKKSQGGQR